MFTTSRLIAPSTAPDGAPTLVGDFSLESERGAVVRAVLRYSALGLVDAVLNGAPVSEDVLTPGWSSYEWRVRVAEADVTRLLAPRSTLELTLGNGWYRGGLTWTGSTGVYGDRLAAIAELTVEYADGHVQVWGTDATWSARVGETLSDDLYNGQTIDARRRGVAADSGPVEEIDAGEIGFESYVGPPVARVGMLEPVRVFASPSGRVIVDFGENIVGWVRAELAGARGETVTIRHSEVLEHGEIAVRPLRSAQATDRFILSGGHDVFEPTFTFHGFRYAEVDGWPGGLEAIRRGGIRAVRISSRMRRIGRFSSSEPLLNRLHENVVSSTLGNFVGLPTDCPQRDERLGWTGDIAVFAATSARLFDVEGFLRDWLRDVLLEQEHHGGIVPYVVPDVLKYVGVPEDITPVDSTAIWSDAIVWVPWAVWMATGDDRVLRETFDGMLAHLRHVAELVSESGLWDRGFQFGDWLDPDAPPEDPAAAKADRALVATACLYRSASLAREAADVIGRSDVVGELESLRDRTRAAFGRSYVDVGNRRLRNDVETSYALAIVFGLLDEEERTWAGARLAELVESSGHRISTGFAGTPYILDALSSTGHIATAGRLLLQRECPSWLYPVTMGATTVWERWDSMLPDGSINPGEMTSFNHYALGAVADWMHRVLGGLEPTQAGYARVLIAPQPIDGVDHVSTSIDTPHGEIAVSWRRMADSVELDATVPEGIVADIRMGEIELEVRGGRHSFTAQVSPSALSRVRQI
ncbi:alpha-L-rhamnosidase [Microbacterium oleivorans]|uniref:alpha-L-rhamnosidase n=1 Tax=Microbacterium oleivorans TaxID=273677 RepID=UPI002040C751|nr:alpha-L-rhamnosidase [Microbacterium oleivorans]MCM3697696.1 glycoside hydrolase family 78 protein [Microbacterium oleivorans]